LKEFNIWNSNIQDITDNDYDYETKINKLLEYKTEIRKYPDNNIIECFEIDILLFKNSIESKISSILSKIEQELRVKIKDFIDSSDKYIDDVKKLLNKNPESLEEITKSKSELISVKDEIKKSIKL